MGRLTFPKLAELLVRGGGVGGGARFITRDGKVKDWI